MNCLSDLLISFGCSPPQKKILTSLALPPPVWPLVCLYPNHMDDPMHTVLASICQWITNILTGETRNNGKWPVYV